ncbi:MAG: phosphoglycerate kinase [Candidatus Altiarchaeota archaeon]
MFDGIKTLDDVDVTGKKVLVRLDLNSPIDPKTGDILDDRRFRSHKQTLLELIEKKCKIVLLAHQGRPGEPDFTTLEQHGLLLEKVLGHKLQYLDSLVSRFVIEKIEAMAEGEIIILENTRFYSEEVLKRPADVQATTLVVQKLYPHFDYFVNDAFAVAHRSQPTVVGFPQLMESLAGRLMEKEVTTITNTIKNPKKPVVFLLGGTKADDSIKIATKALESGTDTILTGGVVANIFLAAKGYRIGEPSIEFIRGKKMTDQITIARELLSKYEDQIIVPKDVALDENGKRVEIPLSELPQNYRIADIGEKTIEEYRKKILKAGTIFANGAFGVFESKNFAKGTEEIIKAIAESKGFSVIGGGHTCAAARGLDVEDKIDHISSGGGACINLLAGYKLPGIEALKGKA